MITYEISGVNESPVISHTIDPLMNCEKSGVQAPQGVTVNQTCTSNISYGGSGIREKGNR